MKMGMSRKEAWDRVEDGEFTWEDLRQIMLVTHPALVGENGRAPSKVNRSMSLATAFNIHWRGLQGKSGDIWAGGDIWSYGNHAIATNLLRDFGFSNAPKKKPKVEVKVHQEDLIELDEDIPINSFEEYVRAFGHTDMSKSTWELQNNHHFPLVMARQDK